MQELRLVAVSEDGTYLVLASAGRGTRFTLPVDDRLRAAVRGQFSRLGQYEIEVENPLRPKEIQARIRSGETAEAIAELAGIPIERIRWFEGPVLQEREYMAQQAQRATVRGPGDAAPGPVLGDAVTGRIGAHQLETGDAVWDSWKREDNTWQLRLAFLLNGDERLAHWVFEPRRRTVVPADEEAVRFTSPDAPEADAFPAPVANVTPFTPRRSTAPPPAVPQAPPAAPRPQQGRPLQAPAARVDFEPSRPAEPPARREEPAARPEATERRERAEAPERFAPPPEQPPAGGRRGVQPERDRGPSSDDLFPPEPLRPQRRSVDMGNALGTGDRRPPTEHDDREPVHPDRPAADEDPERDSQVPAAAGGTAQPARRKGRGRRASVPSWDEIMFGSKKSD